MHLLIAPILAVVLALGMAGCANSGTSSQKAAANVSAASENPYTTSFVNRDRPAVELQPDPTGPKIYRGNVKEDDYQRMLENGFDMLGYSSFEGPDVPPELLAEQARKIKADLALVYTRLVGSVPANVQIQQRREEALQADAGKDPAPSGTPLPQQQARYSYFASYWVKLAPPLIGVHVAGPTESTESGLKVLAVIKQSPAEKAGIQDGDVLTRIGDVELLTPEALNQAAQQYAGQSVDITFLREGSTGNTSMTLNRRQ